METLEKEGFTVKLQSGKVKVINGSRVVLSGIQRDYYVYSLDGHAVAGELNASVEEKDNLAQVWHKRLGHISEARLQVLEKLGLFGKKSLGGYGFISSGGLSSYALRWECGSRTGQTLDLIDYQLARDRVPRIRTKPFRFLDESNMAAYTFVAAEEEDTHEPLTYQEAVACEDSSKKNKTWELVDHPTGQKLVNCKWLFKIKEGIADYELEKLDVKTTFLHENLEEVIYMRQPPGYEQDDMLIACKSKAEIESTKSLLKKEFDMKELGEAKKILENEKSVNMPLGGNFKLSLKDCPVRDCDVERMSKVPYANAGTANVGLVYGTNCSNYVDVTGFVDSDCAKDPDKEAEYNGPYRGCEGSYLAKGNLGRKAMRQNQKRHVSNSRSRKGTYAEDADINSVNDKQPMAEVQRTAEHNILANEQQHYEQSESIYGTYLLEKVNRNTTPDSTYMSHRGGEIDQNAEKCQVSCPLLDPSFDNMTI
ncbi:retrotransposon protein, putative, ty1-copia subclass [Tanacetum coccineum]|uniref:Retrotransposon protein, putative, ty1-copia subclass n=1 Tax=Tanacetum coccineum TaxID=301880 RepID=A0ABQ4YQT4_9ASTR